MTISKYNSDKIRLLSFVAVLFVIYIHSPYLEATGYPIAQCVQRFVADFGLAIFAVPMFYAISGLLFSKNKEARPVSSCSVYNMECILCWLVCCNGIYSRRVEFR